MRDLNDVILQLLAVIPIEESELRNQLEPFLGCDSSFLINWNEVGDILYTYVFSDFYPEIGWQTKVEQIWTGDENPEDIDYTNF